MMEGKKVIMAGSNNYLGLTAHPQVKEAAIAATRKYGTGCWGSRYLTGTLDLHVELETRFGEIFRKEACLLFSTGYQTGQGVIATLVQRREYVIGDKENHASLISATLIAKGAMADVARYKHNDMKDLERQLKHIGKDKPKLIVSDGIFSVTGELLNLPALIALAKEYNARVLIDDAHALGVIGVGGRGTANKFGLSAETDMTMGTFSKTLASLGGFVVAEERVINYLKHTSPPLIFSASPTPASAAAALAALDILEREPERVTKLCRNAEKMRKGFAAMGFHTFPGESAIVPVIIGDEMKAIKFWRSLYDAGVFVNVFITPAVPPGMQMLRTSYMSTHEDEHLDKILDMFEQIGKKLGVLGGARAPRPMREMARNNVDEEA